jgi:hypothetical protein
MLVLHLLIALQDPGTLQATAKLIKRCDAVGLIRRHIRKDRSLHPCGSFKSHAIKRITFLAIIFNMTSYRQVKILVGCEPIHYDMSYI